jgi:hypothetical protein
MSTGLAIDLLYAKSLAGDICRGAGMGAKRPNPGNMPWRLRNCGKILGVTYPVTTFGRIEAPCA